MIFEWQAGLWQRVLDSAGRMPHALLFAGPAGGGKRDFAEALAARVLCARPGSDGHACGGCEDCLWRIAGNHPDLIRVIPEADRETPDDAPEKPEGGKPRPAGVVQGARHARPVRRAGPQGLLFTR